MEVSEKKGLVDKKSWIAQAVNDRSFIDIGGLWGTKNEMITGAIAAGARRAVMADIAPLGHQLWRDFDDHCRELGVSGYDCVSVDITAHNAAERLGKVDVVHCSGIIYHIPDPFGMILNLRAIVGEALVLTSMVVPQVMAQGDRRIDLGQSGARFVPGLSAEEREIAGAHLDALGLKVDGITRPKEGDWVNDRLRPTFGPWWWLLTPSFLRKMLEAARFRIVDEGESWSHRSYSFLCQPV